MARPVAESRRTQLVSTFGVGALFPALNESFMIAGLDQWKEYRSPEVPEPRLARSLGVRTFRMPPAGGRESNDLPVIRFPRIHHCPGCGRLDYITRFGKWNEHVCHDCDRELIPSRFVTCCTLGHIDDFPYFSWVHRGQEAPEDSRHRLSLATKGRSSSLSDIVISCSCGVPPRTMAGSFGAQSLRDVSRCWGKRPWLLGTPDVECSQVPRTLQRGGSNVWFAHTRSAISIPPWSEGVHKVIGQHWSVVQAIPAVALRETLEAMGIAKTTGLRVDDLVEAILDMRGEGDRPAPTDEDLRNGEYGALVLGRPEQDPTQQFVCLTTSSLSAEADRVLGGLAEVSRLREVRALAGFTRVMPPDDSSSANVVAHLSAKPLDWLPAVEVLGEGVFVRLREELVAEWEGSSFAAERADAITRAYEERTKLLGIPAPDPVRPRQLLLHSFAHVLLTELSLDAGYPVASLRERVYHGPGQSGVLIYTASADSAGSLGGLSAQADPDRFWAVLRSAIKRSRWCSSDPVCIESRGTGSDALNLAACHACLLLPETSCEAMNHELDRATLIGLPGHPDSGFFHELVD